MKELIEVSQPLLKLIQECINKDVQKYQKIEEDDYSNPAYPVLRAYKDGCIKGLTKLLEYVIIHS